MAFTLVSTGFTGVYRADQQTLQGMTFTCQSEPDRRGTKRLSLRHVLVTMICLLVVSLTIKEDGEKTTILGLLLYVLQHQMDAAETHSIPPGE